MSSLATNAITDASGGNTTTINGYTPTESNMAGRNRIINGDMRIDQRNAGAAVTASGAFPVDRFFVSNTTDGAFSAQQDSDVPAGSGFTASAKLTVTTADATLTTTQLFAFRQNIEGNNLADLGFGASGAKTITVSFWVRSSLTGTFGGAVRNSAANRSYVFTYSISAADTWEYKTITIPGDTTGTWLKDNGIGFQFVFSLGAGPSLEGAANVWSAANLQNTSGAVNVMGTLNATFYITGVQLEAGSVATPFERRFYGQELALCQRYYYQYTTPATLGQSGASVSSGYSVYFGLTIPFKVSMRTSPTILQNLSISTNSTGTQAFNATTEGYGLTHGNMSGNYSYISGEFKVQAEL